MSDVIIEKTCEKCSGDGLVKVGPPNNPADLTCPDCEGTGLMNFCQSSDLDTRLSDLEDKVDNIMNKCNDIFEKVNE